MSAEREMSQEEEYRIIQVSMAHFKLGRVTRDEAGEVVRVELLAFEELTPELVESATIEDFDRDVWRFEDLEERWLEPSE